MAFSLCGCYYLPVCVTIALWVLLTILLLFCTHRSILTPGVKLTLTKCTAIKYFKEFP